MTFASHLDGHRIFMGPEESMRIQSNLGSDIAMAFDECVENPAPYDYAKASCERTLRWLKRCKAEHDRLNSLPDTVNPRQMLFGINQGATYADLRIWHMQQIAKIDCDGFAIGGLAVGEPTEVMYEIIDAVEPYMPADKPRYLMGVGTPSNIIEGVARGVDFFDCVMPARNARHGKLFTWQGTMNIKNAQYKLDDGPIDPQCDCPVCRKFSRAYLRHLFTAQEMLGMRLAVLHNLYFYNNMMTEIRTALDEGAREIIIGIGGKLEDGKEHDLRAPDYDDYSTIDERSGLAGLNGDLLIWYPILGRAIELSSMGIRVDKETLLRQLQLSGKEDRKKLYFHRRLLDGTLPQSIGGGIGQSRLCMVLLHKAHVGETQSSIWPEEMRQECKEAGIILI